MAEIRKATTSIPGPLRAVLSRAGIIIPAIIVIAGVFTSYFTIPTDSQGVILRFGKFNRIADPGLHFKLPFWFETTDIVPVERTLKMEFGYGTPGSTNPYQTRPKEHRAEQTMITGDKAEALVQWAVQYRISDPKAYLFNVAEPEDTLRDATESAMREVVGDRSVNDLITTGRQVIAAEALVKIQELADSYGLGLQIDKLQLTKVNPPLKVQPSFNEVNQAEQEKESQINVALGLYNKAVPRTEGEADQRVSSAEGDKAQRVNEATGDAERFLALFAEYQKAPEITRQRLYLEKIKDVMPKLRSKIIMDPNSNKPIPLLDLNNALQNTGKGGAR